MGYLDVTWTQVFTRERRADVSFRDVKIKIPDRGMWMTSCTASECGGFWGIWKNEKDRLSGLAEIRRICALRAPHVMGGRWKSQNRKNVYLSPYVQEPLNSKVIKIFVPELRSRKCFSCFGIPLFYVYRLWTFYVRFTHPYLAMVQCVYFLFSKLNRKINNY